MSNLGKRYAKYPVGRQIRMTEGTAHQLEARAAQEGVSVREIVRRALDRYLDEVSTPPPERAGVEG